MNCEMFARLLDQTGGEGMPETAFRHAAHCARCATAFADARSLERVLASGGGASFTGAGFTDAVMARVALAPQVRVAPVAVPRATWRDAVNLPVVAAAVSGAALLAIAASAGFDPARIAELLTSGAGVALPFAWPEWSPLTPAAQYAWWGVAGSLAAIAILTGWWVGSLWGEGPTRTR